MLAHPVARQVIARAPTRIDLGGGWTDVPPYCEREGGFVCNVAISRYATAVLSPLHGPAPVSASARDEDRDAGRIDDSDSPLVRAALKRSGASDVRVRLANDFPVGAGLGGSSAASAAVLGALAEWRGMPWDRADIAEEGRRIEVEELGVAGGRQDHYAATHGGALALTFSTTVDVRRIPLDAGACQHLRDTALLIYTGESRISGDTITAVLGAYERGERRVLNALQRMRELAMDMALALARKDFDALGELLGEHWRHQRSLHPSIPTARIDEIVSRAASAGALGAKAMGASGGGCVLVLSRPGDVQRVRQSVAPLGEVLSFGIDEAGLSVESAA